jgi:hypothetical protein
MPRQSIKPRLSLDETEIFSLIVSQALLISTSVSKFYKAENVFEISTRYYSLPSTSFNFLRLNLSIRNLCIVCLLTASLSLNLLPTLPPSPPSPLITQFEIKTLIKGKYLPFAFEARLSHMMINGIYKNSTKNPENENERFFWLKNSILRDVGRWITDVSRFRISI